jgi:4a-hydroxytetrahydrobiopterin dehydratase
VAEKLDKKELEDALAELDGWIYEADALSWQKTFGSFAEAFAFTTRVALLAERRDHHPDITLSYTRLGLRLKTHDAGGVTARDVRFARDLEAWG